MPTAGLPPSPSVTSSTPSFNGTWFSSQYNFGFRIDGRIGRATKSNSPKFAPGDIILHIESLSENQFQGQQMYTDGNWYKVSGELLDAQTLKMRDDSTLSLGMHTMTRQAEREQPQIVKSGDKTVTGCTSGIVTQPTLQKGYDGSMYEVSYDYSHGQERINPSACGREYWISRIPNHRNYGIRFVYLVDAQRKRVDDTLYVEKADGTLTISGN